MVGKNPIIHERLNAPIESKLAIPIGKTKTKKIGEQIKKEK